MAEGLADEVRPGLEIDQNDYTFVEGDEFAITDVLRVFSRFLALPMYIDSFPDHATRVATFNQVNAAGKIPKELFDCYFQNKLRTNKLYPVVSYVSILARMRGNPPEFKRFMNEECKTVSLESYSELPLAAKLEKVAEVERLANSILNKMVELGMVEGPWASNE